MANKCNSNDSTRTTHCISWQLMHAIPMQSGFWHQSQYIRVPICRMRACRERRKKVICFEWYRLFVIDANGWLIWWFCKSESIYLRDRSGSPASISTSDIFTDACDFLGGFTCSFFVKLFVLLKYCVHSFTDYIEFKVFTSGPCQFMWKQNIHIFKIKWN